jgi:hypothetical protein
MTAGVASRRWIANSPLSPAALPGDGRRGDAAVAHDAERFGEATLHRQRLRADAAEHVAVAQRLVRVILIVDDEIEQDAVLGKQCGHAGQEPARQRVGVDCDGEALPGAFGFQFAALKFADQVGLHQSQLLDVALQNAPRRRRAHRLAAHQQALAEPRFQAADAQRDGGQRQVERPGSGAETAVFEHGSQGFELIGVKHGCSIPPAR